VISASRIFLGLHTTAASKTELAGMHDGIIKIHIATVAIGNAAVAGTAQAFS
jgi:hypothetical protein